MKNIILLLTFFNLVAFWASLLAIRFWLGIYDRAKHGSIAWLLFGIASVYMLSIALFPHVILHLTSLELETKYRVATNYMIFWSTVYTIFFAAAGYVLYKTLVSCPKKRLSKLLIEGLATKKEKIKPEFNIKEEDFISEIIKGKNLVRYSPESDYENSIIELVLRLWGELRNAVLITTYPKSLVYEEKLRDLLSIGAIKLVELKTTEDCVRMNGNIISSSIYSLNSLKKALSNLPSDCVLIVELTKLKLSKISDAEKLLELPYDIIAFVESTVDGNLERYFDKVGEVRAKGIRFDSKVIGFRVGEKFYL